MQLIIFTVVKAVRSTCGNSDEEEEETKKKNRFSFSLRSALFLARQQPCVLLFKTIFNGSKKGAEIRHPRRRGVLTLSMLIVGF